MTLQPGDHLPDLTLDSLDGPVRLSERWTRQPLVITFMRHCLGDPTRAGSKAVGLDRGELKEYMGLRVYRHWIRAAKVGAYVGRPQGDIAQRPGTFVIDSEGQVLLAHYNRSSPDNPAIADLVEALKRPTLRPRG
jgi:hypothetical protein